MKRKTLVIILVIFIIFILIFFSIVTLYKTKHDNENYEIISLSNEKITVDTNYLNDYGNYIDNYIKFTDFEMSIFDEGNTIDYLFGKEDGYLMVKNKTTGEIIKPINERINNFAWDTDINTNQFNCFYVLTTQENLYKVEFISHDPIKVKAEKINNNIKVSSFLIEAEYGNYRDEQYVNIGVIGDDNNIYVMPYETLFVKYMQIIKEKLIVYDDKKISSIDGKILKDKKGNYYMAKWVFEITSDNPFENSPEILVITEDSKIIYLINDKIYEYKKKIKDILYTYVSEETGTLELKYEDEAKMKFDVQFDSINYGFILN